MARAIRASALLIGVAALAACGSETEASDLKVERLPDVKPNLPQVPDLPDPPHPIQHSDDSYSIYGLRTKMPTGDRVEVTGYIVEIYEPPECEEDERCEVKAPHMWIADAKDETEASKRLQVVGYAENHEQIEDAKDEAEEGASTYVANEDAQEVAGILPIPVDFYVGNKVKVDGMFVHLSSSGFMSADGVLEYRDHETLEAVEPEEDDS